MKKFSAMALVILAAFGSLAPKGCENLEEKDKTAIDRSYVALSPVAVMVPKSKLSSSAEYFSSLRPNTMVLYLNGADLLPRYKDGSALVVEKIPYNNLSEGMTVVFATANGTMVVHYLARKNEDGWTAISLNKENINAQVLTSDRYVGVVIMAFSPEN